MTASQLSPGARRRFVRVDHILGRADDDEWRGILAGADIDTLRLDQAEAQKSRLRKATDGGLDLAITLDRSVQVRDGDVLFWNGAARAAVVARVDLQDVLIIDLSALQSEPAAAAMARCVELGHALGNQHWPAVIKGMRVFVPLTVAHAVMASVMKTHAFEGVTYAFAPGAEVVPYLAPHEARRLFGADQSHRHDRQAGEASS